MGKIKFTTEGPKSQLPKMLSIETSCFYIVIAFFLYVACGYVFMKNEKCHSWILSYFMRKQKIYDDEKSSLGCTSYVRMFGML